MEEDKTIFSEKLADDLGINVEIINVLYGLHWLDGIMKDDLLYILKNEKYDKFVSSYSTD